MQTALYTTGRADPDSMSSHSVGKFYKAPTSSQRSICIVLIAVLGLLGLWTLWSFLSALAWATILAIATWPLYKRLVQVLPERQRNGVLAPAIFTSVVGLVLVAPVIIAAIQVGHEAIKLVNWTAAAGHTGMPLPDWLIRLPVFGRHLSSWWQANLSDPVTAGELLGHLNQDTLVVWTGTLGAQLAQRLMLFLVTLLAFFFLLRDGTAITQQALELTDRLWERRGRMVAYDLVAAVRGTVNGLVLVGLGEGVLLGLGYAMAGLPNPALLGALTAVLAMIPFGAPVVIAAGSLVLLAQSGPVPATVLFAFGIVVVFVADHFVRPLLIGSAVRLSFLWVLLGIVGGLETFGFLGLILGPTVMAAFATSWREWRTCEAIDARAASREGAVTREALAMTNMRETAAPTETAEGSANCPSREFRP